MALKIIACPWCGREARITYEENRVYQMKCYSCQNTMLHEDRSFDRAVEFFEHQANLLYAEQDGRLVVLPCKVGDTVYQVDYMTHGEALKSGIPQSKDPYQNRKYARKRAEYLPMIVRERKMVKTLYREIGKTVFLTREEAEAALKKENHNDG